MRKVVVVARLVSMQWSAYVDRCENDVWGQFWRQYVRCDRLVVCFMKAQNAKSVRQYIGSDLFFIVMPKLQSPEIRR